MTEQAKADFELTRTKDCARVLLGWGFLGIVAGAVLVVAIEGWWALLWYTALGASLFSMAIGTALSVYASMTEAAVRGIEKGMEAADD